MDAKIKLAMFWAAYSPFGSSYNEILELLDPDRFDLIFISLQKNQGDPEEVLPNGHKVYYLGSGEKARTHHVSRLRKLINIIKEEKIDILHAHRFKPTHFAAMARLFTSVPVVLSHVHGINRSRTLWRKMQNILLFRILDRVIGCSEGVKRDVELNNLLIPKGKVIAIENSIEVDRYSQDNAKKADIRSELMPFVVADSFLFGVVARLGPFKGHNFLVEAFKEVKTSVPNARMVFIGDGPKRNDLEQQVSDSGLTDSIHFMGRRPDVPKLLKCLDVFVLPSIGSEGMPLSILEAMASGLPCISTNVSGIPEIINSEKVGTVIEPKDSKSLAETMIRYARMPQDQIDELKRNSIERVNTTFSHQVVIKKIQHLYESELELSR